jgi:biotin carboxyl carrier protein
MIKKLRVTVDGKPYEVTVEVPEESEAGSVTHAAPRHTAPTTVSPTSVPPAKTQAAPGDVPSPLGGRVVAIDTKVGQKVNEGDNLLTIETMKMNTFVCAAKGGQVTEILVSVGDVVKEGQILARIG